MTSYPSNIVTFREKVNLPGMEYDPDDKRTLYVEDMQVIENEVIAIEEILGEEVQGSYDSLVDRLDAQALGGDVVGPSSATDDGVATFDGTTGKIIQNSVLKVTTDAGNAYIDTKTEDMPIFLGYNNSPASVNIGNVVSTGSIFLNSAEVYAVGTLYQGATPVVTTTGTQTVTNKDLSSGNTFPTFNQNTTGSAARLTTSRTIHTNLGSTSSASFDGTANITPGVSGTLPIANGGTGSTTEAALAITVGNLLMPVGYVVTLGVSTNPGTLYGFGTWVEYGPGRVIVSKSASGTFGTAGATGGSETHTLTTNEMPSHNHVHRQWLMNGAGSSGAHYGFGYQLNTGARYDSVEATTTGEVQFGNLPAGSNQAHNNLQPYIVAYVWMRTG